MFSLRFSRCVTSRECIREDPGWGQKRQGLGATFAICLLCDFGLTTLPVWTTISSIPFQSYLNPLYTIYTNGVQPALECFQKQCAYHFRRKCYIHEHLCLLGCFSSKTLRPWKPGDVSNCPLWWNPQGQSLHINLFFLLSYYSVPTSALDYALWRE